MTVAYNEITNDEAREIAAGGQTGRDTLRTMGQELLGCGAKMTLGAGTATVATMGVPVKLASTTAEAGSSNGFTVATTQRITAAFKGTRLVRVQAVLLADLETGTDAINFHIFKNGVSVFESAANSVASETDEYFEIDAFIEMSEDDYIEIYAENEDATANITTTAYAERVNTTPSHGYVIVSA